MSQSKLEKCVNRPLKCDGKIRKHAILISYSKGNYIRKHTDIIPAFGGNLRFICKGGARFADQFVWLENNLADYICRHGQTVLYIWLGTCDLTTRNGRFIHLRHGSDRLG